MNATKSELVKIILSLEEELDAGINAAGFDWGEASERLESAKRELAERFGFHVGHGGILHKV